MRVHILGVCGTFMGGIAAIAKEAGHDVSGADQNVYPPMSTQLEALGIQLVEGYEAPSTPPSRASSSATRCRAASPSSKRC